MFDRYWWFSWLDSLDNLLVDLLLVVGGSGRLLLEAVGHHESSVAVLLGGSLVLVHLSLLGRPLDSLGHVEVDIGVGEGQAEHDGTENKRSDQQRSHDGVKGGSDGGSLGCSNLVS